MPTTPPTGRGEGSPPKARIRWRVTGSFVVTVGAWGMGMGSLSALVADRRLSASPAAAHVVSSALGGPPAVVGAIWALGLVVALFLHEVGHAVAARQVGSPEVAVVFHGLHGRTSYSLDDPWSGRRALVVAAGALAPVLLVPMAWVSHLLPLAIVGGLLVSLNLLPIPVSDGGHLLAVAMHRLLPTEATAATVTEVACVGILATGFILGSTMAIYGLSLLCGVGLELTAVVTVRGRKAQPVLDPGTAG